MSWTFMQSFSFIPLMASEKKIFEYFFRKFSLSVAMATNQNICSNTEINANFHFSHYKSMETLSCHSNESTWAMAIKNIIYVEANVMNMYAKFQLHPLMASEEKIFNIFSKIYPLCCHGNQSNSAIWTKFIWIIEDYSRNISVEKNSKYLQWDSKNCHFPLFPL